jgi:roadblock/LC7 domain-containing protein
MQSSFDFKSAAFSEFAFTSCGFTEDIFTVVAGNYSLCVTEDDGSFVAASTLDIHEIGVGGGNESLEFV